MDYLLSFQMLDVMCRGLYGRVNRGGMTRVEKCACMKAGKSSLAGGSGFVSRWRRVVPWVTLQAGRRRTPDDRCRIL